ncbi:hypothetical protein GCM10027343_41620 [Noviherbaspirillum agri]
MLTRPGQGARASASLLRVAGICAVLLASAPAVSAMTLDDIYGGMAKGCTYDQEGNYKLITAYVDEHLGGPKLTRPDGGKRLAPFFGRAKLRTHGESYTLTIPVSGAALYDIPVSQIAPYRGIGAGIAGVAITFSVPVDEVKTRLAHAGVKLVPHDHGWGDIMPELQPAPDGKRTELVCDLSM